MRLARNTATTVLHLERAATRGRAVTIRALKEETQKTESGKKRKTGRMVETVRTIEIYGSRTTKAGDILYKAMDRESGEPRHFYAHRIMGYTLHHAPRLADYQIDLPQEIAEELAEQAKNAPPSEAEFIARELERDYEHENTPTPTAAGLAA